MKPGAPQCSIRTIPITFLDSISCSVSHSQRRCEQGIRQRGCDYRGRPITRRCKSTPFCSPKRVWHIWTTQGRVTVIVAGQWTWEDQHQIAHALNLPPGTSACDLSGNRRRVRRARRYVGADYSRARGAEIETSRQNHLVARRIHQVSRQAPPDVFPRQNRRQERWHAGRGRSGIDC